MSANNYMLIHKVGKKYYIWDNLMAEESDSEEPLCLKNAVKSFKRLSNAINWAVKNDDTEYGYQLNDLHKPKDGFKEIIETEVNKIKLIKIQQKE